MLTFGCKKLDELMGGGIPENRVLSIHARPNTGKSWLACQIALANPEKKSIILDTEERGDLRKKVAVLNRRFQSKMRPVVLAVNSMEEFMGKIGYSYSVSLEKDKADVRIKDKGQWKYDAELLIIDSCSNLIKIGIPATTQDLPARASVIAFIFKRLYSKLDEMTLILTHHTSASPLPWEDDKVFGGDALVYFSKYILEIRNATSALRDRFGKDVLRVRRIRHPTLPKSEHFPVRLKQDWGFIDV